jgi:hypothetical protein
MRAMLAVAGVIAIALSVGAQEIPPNTAPSTTTEGGRAVGKLDTQKKTGKAEQEDSKPAPVPPCIHCSNCCPVEQPYTKSKEEQAKADSLDLLYRRYLWATIIGVGAGVVGAIALIWSTILTRRAANAALLNAQAVIGSERAWMLPAILVEPSNLLEMAHDSYPNSIEIAVRFSNAGRTPAWVTGWYCTTLVIPNERVTPFEYGEGRSSLSAGEPMPAGSSDNLFADFAVTEPSIGADIRQGRAYFYVYGFLNYRDVFNRTHETYFSRRYSRRQIAPGTFEEGWIVIGPEGANRNT